MDYKQAKEYLFSINSRGIILGLDTMKALLAKLGNPQDKLRFIHIAGTNGKGSVGAYLSYILAASGYRVGRYLSPAVFDDCEIIQVLETVREDEEKEEDENRERRKKEDENRERRKKEDAGKRFCSSMIQKEAIARHITMIKAVIDKLEEKGMIPTVFEIETAMAFLEFLEKDCDIVVLETGMGGTLDATNIVKNVECSIFVSISRDHMAFLGDTLEKIAEEKAGIIKESVPVISSPQKQEVKKILQKRAKEKNVEISFVEISHAKQILHRLNGREVSVCNEEKETKVWTEKEAWKECPKKKSKEKNGIYFTYCDKGKQWEIYLPLLGAGQLENALTALKAAEVLKDKKGYHITEESIKEGLSNTVWQGRFQILKEQPLIIIDGAHNEAAAEKLTESITMYLLGNSKGKKGRLIYILGIFKDKEINKIIEKTVPMADLILTVTPDSPRGFSSDQLKKRIECFWSKIEKKGAIEDCKTAEQGLKRALQLTGKEDTILIFGSLSLLRSVCKEIW